MPNIGITLYFMRLPVVVGGGAPLNEESGTASGEDAYSREPATAVEVARDMVQQRRAS